MAKIENMAMTAFKSRWYINTERKIDNNEHRGRRGWNVSLPPNGVGVTEKIIETRIGIFEICEKHVKDKNTSFSRYSKFFVGSSCVELMFYMSEKIIICSELEFSY